REPPLRTLTAPGDLNVLGVVRAHVSPSASQIAAVESEYLLPAVVRSRRPVCRPVHREESMSCVVIGMELVRLAEVGQDLRQLSRLLGRRVLVVSAEQPEQRAR